MRGWCWCLVLVRLAGEVVLDSHPDRKLLCECTTAHCRGTNTSTCYSQYKCYTQYLNKTDGSHPVTRGCVQSVTPILCENRRPQVRIRINWPYLKCCDSGDLCNSAVMSTPPSWVSSTISSSKVDQDPNGRKRNRHLLCECNTAHCRNINRSTCHTNYKCYTQYVLDSSEEGRMLTTRGCAQDNNGNLCDGRDTSGRYRGSFVRCCNTGDLCNSAVMSTPAAWDTPTTSTTENNLRVNTSTQTNITSTPRTDVGSSLVALWLRNSERSIAGNAWPVSKPAVLAVLCVGLFLLIGIMAFGFYILKVQSNYLTQLRRGYARATEEEPMTVVSSSISPPYHMSLLPSNSEQNNNSKSVET
ncbi:uncharacterized protein [Periplaneta americana]|uniref:uncharacterized protein n=1 Tax=Periplaneta americana TaxID=6978 RepID=UPI0037E99A38